MIVKHKCSKDVPEGGRSISFYPCQRPATVERDGQWWCWQHDPIRVEADKEKRRADWNAKANIQTAMWERRARNAKLAALVTVEMAELLERLAEGAQMWSMEEMDNDDIKQGRALAARIREALALEADDES